MSAIKDKRLCYLSNERKFSIDTHENVTTMQSKMNVHKYYLCLEKVLNRYLGKNKNIIGFSEKKGDDSKVTEGVE